MLKIVYGLLVCVALDVFLVVPGHSDVIITVGVNAFGDLHYRSTPVTFSEKYFNQFYKCLCENRSVCKAKFDSYKQVTNVWHENRSIYGSVGPSYYYYCSYKATQEISCVRSVTGLYYEAFHVLGTECRHSCVGLFWFYEYEGPDFRNSELTVQYCYDKCNCSESNTAATTPPPPPPPPPTTTTTATTTTTITTTTALTTTAAATATTTTTTTTTLTTTASATTTTITIPSSTTIKTTPETSSTGKSTPESPASIFPKDESGDDPQVGLIIGVVFTIIIIAFIIAVIGIFLWRRKRKQEASIPLNGTQNSTASNNFNNVISEVQKRLTKTRNNYRYNVAPSYYNNINSNCENNGHFAREATSLSSENSINNFQTKSPENDLENTKTSPERSTDDSEAVIPSPTHNLQTANQLSRCSFVRPISDRLSNENTDLIAETNNAAASQNHIYYVLEGGKENNDITDSHRNIYFELEKQEDVSETDTEED